MLIKRGVSRREFLKIVAAVSMVGAGSGLLAPQIIEARGRDQKRKRRRRRKGKRDELKEDLEKILEFGVRGVERNNKIPERLACNLASIGGRSRKINKKIRRLLRKAAKEVEKNQEKSSSDEIRTVTQNLNDLLGAILNRSAPFSVTDSLSKAVIVTVLFATHGEHFGDTREAHRNFRNALLALKNRNSTEPISSRVNRKRSRLRGYRREIAIKCDEVFRSGEFPENVSIRSVWIMPRSIED